MSESGSTSASPNDEKGGSQIVPDKPGSGAEDERKSDHEQDREGTAAGSAHEEPDSF